MMNMEEVKTFTVEDEDGNIIECEVIFTFQSDQTGGSYIVFTDGTTDEEGSLELQAARFDPNAEELELLAIENEVEQELVTSAIDQMIEIQYEEEN